MCCAVTCSKVLSSEYSSLLFLRAQVQCWIIFDLQMVNTLAMFLSPQERLRSRYAVETSGEVDSDLFDPDLFVQGLLKARLVICDA